MTQKRVLHVHLYDGNGDAFSRGGVTTVLMDGREELDRMTHKEIRQFVKYNVVINDVGDDRAFQYRVQAWADLTKQAGVGPVTVSPQTPKPVHLMLMPASPEFEFPTFDALSQKSVFIHNVFQNNDPVGHLYADAAVNRREALGTVFNVLTAIEGIDDTKELISMYQEIFKSPNDILEIRPDRFYARVNPRLLDLVSGGKFGFHQEPTGDHEFKTADGTVFKPIKDQSYKEKRYPEANVQFIFYKVGNDLVVENDMDLFRNPLSHFFFELIPNDVIPAVLNQEQKLTDPHQIYWRRWMVSRNDASPRVFAPPLQVKQKVSGI